MRSAQYVLIYPDLQAIGVNIGDGFAAKDMSKGRSPASTATRAAREKPSSSSPRWAGRRPSTTVGPRMEPYNGRWGPNSLAKLVIIGRSASAYSTYKCIPSGNSTSQWKMAISSDLST